MVNGVLAALGCLLAFFAGGGHAAEPAAPLPSPAAPPLPPEIMAASQGLSLPSQEGVPYSVIQAQLLELMSAAKYHVVVVARQKVTDSEILKALFLKNFQKIKIKIVLTPEARSYDGFHLYQDLRVVYSHQFSGAAWPSYVLIDNRLLKISAALDPMVIKVPAMDEETNQRKKVEFIDKVNALVGQDYIASPGAVSVPRDPRIDLPPLLRPANPLPPAPPIVTSAWQSKPYVYGYKAPPRPQHLPTRLPRVQRYKIAKPQPKFQPPSERTAP